MVGIDCSIDRVDYLQEIIDDEQMERKQKDLEQEQLLIKKYSAVYRSANEQFLKAITNFIAKAKGPEKSLESILKEALEFIRTYSQFKERAIGLRDHDGLYRFKVIAGFDNEAESATREMVFSADDMKDIFTYRPINICRTAQFHLSERKSYKQGTENTFNRPDLLGSERKHPDDMIEGDYIEIPIQGKERDLIGWIEVSGPADGKMPKRETILRIEFFASCLVPIILLLT